MNIKGHILEPLLSLSGSSLWVSLRISVALCSVNYEEEWQNWALNIQGKTL